ncbi:MAG: transketolase, partial [bacterium]|nr:transketolase [bacterium]
RRLSRWRQCVERGGEFETEWGARCAEYASTFPGPWAELQRRLRGEMPERWDDDLPSFPAGTQVATRGASGKVLNALAGRLPEIFGGSADLAGSVKTMLAGIDAFQSASYSGRNVFFGVREHGMGAVMNGLALHGGIRPYGGTFLVFSDYMRPSIRLAAMMGLPAIYLYSHDSIGLGE